jgi:hypothetical protein
MRRRLGAAVAVVLLLQGCGSEVVVRITTRIFEDGSLWRAVRIEGRTGEGEVPESVAWLSEDAGIDVADRDAWPSLEEEPGTLAVEGFFDSVEALPSALSHRTDSGWETDRTPATLEIDDAVVYRRWVWAETYGDPYGPEQLDEAIDTLVELAVEALRHELRDHVGRDVDSRGAEAFLRGEARALAVDLVAVRRETPGRRQLAERREQWSYVLAGYGMRPSAATDAYWEAQVPVLLGWLRERLAAALSTREQAVAADQLTFVPVEDDAEEAVMAMIERVWGDEDAFLEQALPALEALGGFYDSGGGDRYRFEIRVELPGLLVATNGTPVEDGVVWHLRGDDLDYREAVFEAESLEPDDGALRTLGARRRLGTLDLLRLRDILHIRDDEGLLRALLADAESQGDLDVVLEGAEDLPEELAPFAVELVELLSRGEASR